MSIALANSRLRSSASVLLVDDTPANLLALSAVLNPLGVRTVEAKSGNEALDHVAREAFAVALVDVQMPGMDGFELANYLRKMEFGRELPVVFVTALHRDEMYVRRGYAVGAADYITKPFDPDIVRARVKAFVDLFEQREAVRASQVAQRTQERDEALRRLVAFERIATAALETDDLQALLRELLHAFIGAADAADSATILIREGDLLRVQASAGLYEEDRTGFSVAIGHGFAGTIAAERRAMELSDAASSPLIENAWLRKRGTRGLYGVPLVHNGEVLGVAHIGSVASSTFSDAEKRLLSAAAERAALAIGRALEQAQRSELLKQERAARIAAEAANTAKDEFLAVVSHELRTPLNAILGWAVMARTKPAIDRERALSVIERNARTQARIVEDVLDFSRIERGKMRLVLSTLDIDDVVRSAVEVVRPAIDAKALTLELALSSPGTVRGDAERLQQAVWNILTNAAKFTSNGGKVRVETERTESGVRIRVTDTGQGIAAEFLPHIFDAFRQADGSTTRRHGGLGLGLAIVRKIVQAHGGTIDASSPGLGQGSTLVIELPFDRAQEALLRSDECRSSGERGALDRLDGLTVLIAEDDEDGRALIVDILSARGAKVIDCGSAELALAAIGSERPDVIVSDIAMPNIDGYEMIRQVRDLSPEHGGLTPAIAVTAHARTEAQERAFAAGFQAYLAKPIDIDRLVSKVAELGGLKRLSINRAPI